MWVLRLYLPSKQENCSNSKAFPNAVLLTNLFVSFYFPLLCAGNKPSALSHFNMLVMLSVQKHFRLFVLSTLFLSHLFSRTGSLQGNFKNNSFHIAAILHTGAVLNHSCFLLVPHCYSRLVSVFLQVFGLLAEQQELYYSLQRRWADGVGAHSKTAGGISEQTLYSCGRFRFAGVWSKIILLAFYFYVPVLLFLFLNNNCSGFPIK